MTNKRARVNAIRRRRIEVRTFVGYIGLIDGRPDVEMWPNREGSRVVHVFTNERKAKQAYEDVALVTVTGPWLPKRLKTGA